jgi:hypothetical protein
MSAPEQALLRLFDPIKAEGDPAMAAIPEGGFVTTGLEMVNLDGNPVAEEDYAATHAWSDRRTAEQDRREQ